MAEAPAPPKFVNDPRAFEHFAAELASHGEIAVDTEADSYYSYREKVCLIQISTEASDYLIDPLAQLDLAALAPAFASPRIRKVFHDAEYDIQLLKAAGVPEIKNLFDTRLAVSILGSKTPGLANVLRDRYGIQLDKSQQKSDWSRRPLTNEQLLYAREDTRHLLRLARDLERELAAGDRIELFRYECMRTEASAPRVRTVDPADCLSIRGADELDPRGLAALRELYLERERVAGEADLAPFRIIPNELLVLLARIHPRDEHELAGVRALTYKLKEQFGRPALAALARAREQGPWIPRRAAPAFSEEQWMRHEQLKRWRTRKSVQYQLDAVFIVHRRTLEFLAKNPPATLEELSRAPGLSPWQFRNFGEALMREMGSK
ncbi:MAG: HRDC domain-containing protein [Planctomycetes bacterium]|nr:HRDC domain-containing protein [Planctomycetota bacterium]